MSTELFNVLKASAGSGKTYALVKQYLLLALRSEYSRYYRHILAITFTNAAAAEMKERVLERLKEFSTPGFHSGLVDEVCAELNIPVEKLQVRAERTYRDMLHNYGQISILTIDSFTHRIIRSFSRDLHLSHDFTIESDYELFLEKLVDNCLENIGTDGELTEYLTAYALENVEDGKNWNLRDKLISISKQLLQDQTIDSIEKMEHLSLEDFKRIKKDLSSRVRKFEEGAKKIAQTVKDLQHTHNLQNSDFWNGNKGTFNYFDKIISGRFDEPPTSNFHKFSTKDAWWSGKASKATQATISSIIHELISGFESMAAYMSPQHLSEYILCKKIAGNLFAIGLLRTLGIYAEALREEQNILLISDFHRIVNKVITENEAPFIYERIGNRYKNILFDEFQDTSLLQWTNAIPLLENSLAEGQYNLVVGDAKQSIYRWRGGYVEQFIGLPEIPAKSILHANSGVFRSHIKIEQLPFNRRSAQQIVQFNNTFYNQLSEQLGFYQNVYTDSAQECTKKNQGYVQIQRIDGKKNEDRWPFTTQAIEQKIRECLEAGFKPGDIAILVRRGAKEGSKIAEYLVSKNFEVVTRDSFLVQNSPVVRVIISYLQFQTQPDKHFAAIDLVQSLSFIHPDITFGSFLNSSIKREEKKTQIFLESFLENHFGKFEFKYHGGSVIQIATDLLHYFKMDIDSGTEFLLEKIKQQCISRNFSLFEFIDWWEDSKDHLYTSTTENTNAVNIMTIHKSKGLQFPVVIYPRISSPDHVDDIWVEVNEAKYGLPVAYFKPGKEEESEESDAEIDLESDSEREKKKLDDINLCYVATTRAEERLYMIVESGGTTWLSSTINQTINTHYSPAPELEYWESGEKESYDHKEISLPSETVHFRSGDRNAPELKVLPLRRKYTSQIEHGTFIHLCLAEIFTRSDIKQAIKKTSGMLNFGREYDTSGIQKEIENLLEHPDIHHWFVPGLQVITEKEVCTSEGEILRPDRVIVFDDHVDIVDYKTGNERAEYADQVKKYCRHLQEIYDIPVRGYLLYTGESKIVEIEPTTFFS